MNFFSPKQIKSLLIGWPLVLLLLFVAAVYIGMAQLESNVSADSMLMASFFVTIAAQITTIAYFITSAVLLALWFFGGRQRNLRDYGLIMLVVALVFTYVLRDMPLNFWQSF
jgi:hypothetical protein